MRYLSAEHALDVLELQWAAAELSAVFPLVEIARVSGRPVSAWELALASGQAAWPPNHVIGERYDLIRQAAKQRLADKSMALIVRAPRAWCREAASRLPELKSGGLL